MNKVDVPTFTDRLNSLLDAMSPGKPPFSAKGMEMWFETLKEFPAERVLGVLNAWPKLHARFPAPADVWKVCHETALEEREKKAAADRRIFEQPVPIAQQTEGVRRLIAETKKMLERPAPGPREWAKKILDRHRAGEHIRPYVLHCALEASGDVAPRVIEREPGEDDEELAA